MGLRDVSLAISTGGAFGGYVYDQNSVSPVKKKLAYGGKILFMHNILWCLNFCGGFNKRVCAGRI
jgi:hypothetical protein